MTQSGQNRLTLFFLQRLKKSDFIALKWPARSPDLDPFQYLWDAVEREANILECSCVIPSCQNGPKSLSTSIEPKPQKLKWRHCWKQKRVQPNTSTTDVITWPVYDCVINILPWTRTTMLSANFKLQNTPAWKKEKWLCLFFLSPPPQCPSRRAAPSLTAPVGWRWSALVSPSSSTTRPWRRKRWCTASVIQGVDSPWLAACGSVHFPNACNASLAHA